MDEKGIQIQAVMFNEAIDELDSSLKIGKNFITKGVTTTSTVILKSRFQSTWLSWRSIPMDIRTSICHKLLESFQLEDSTSETKMKVREVWEEYMPRLFSTAMYNAREDAMAEAGVENIKDCRDFPPAWLSREIWNKLMDVWEISEWQKKSKIATNNRLGSNQGFGVVIHVGGTASTTRHEKNLEAELGREPLYMETYDRTHKRKGSNDYCDLRSKTVVGKYKATILQKYEDPSTQPRIDVEAWSNAGGGPTKGQVLGCSTRDRASLILGTVACSSSS